MLAGRATDRSFDDEVKQDWEAVFDVLFAQGDNGAEQKVFISPRASQKTRFYYMKAQCGFADSAASYDGTLGAMLVTGGKRPDAEEGIPKLIDLIREHGLDSLIAQGIIRETGKPGSTRAGILNNPGYQYFGDTESGCYHVWTCDHLAHVKDTNFVGLGKNPAIKRWKPCPFCIKKTEPAQTAVPASPARTKLTSEYRSKPASGSGWENRIEQKAKNSSLTKAQIIRKEIVLICEEYGMHAEFSGGTVFVTTVAGEWFFDYNDRPIRLHHKNYIAMVAKIGKSLQHYHLQHERFASPLHALRYISGHDLALKRKVMQEVESERATDEYLSGDIETDIVNWAIVFAAKACFDSTRKGTNLPCILHAAEAAAIAESITDDREVIAAATLHNVLKDTDSKASQIQIEFGVRVRKLVEAGSENKKPGLSAAETWKTRKSETVDYLHSAAKDDECIIALADKLSDIRACVRDYRQIGDAVWEKADMPNREMQAWYYIALCNALGRLQDTGAWQEFDCLVNELFPGIKRKAMPQGDVETAGDGDVEVLKTPKDTL
jgi:hypothetical protein